MPHFIGESLEGERSESERDPWPEIVPLDHSTEPPPLDLSSVIPPSLPQLSAFIFQTATALQVPVEMVAPLVVSVASLGTARAFEVECQIGWKEPAPIWVACLASPGERKSALLGAIAGPVHAWQHDECERLRVDLARYTEERRQLEARLTGIRAAMSKPARRKGDDGPDLADLQRQSDELVESLASMPELRPAELVTGDATPEAARDLLARNGEKLAIIAAEADQLDVLLGRYGDGKANLGLFLAGHAGDPCSAHRVGRDIPLERPALVCCLAVQPQAVEAMLDSPDAVGRGLVARFLFIRPKTLMGHRRMEPPPVERAVAGWWDHAMRKLLDQPWPGKVVIGPDGPIRCGVPTKVLTLTPDARTCLIDLRISLERRLDPENGDLSDLSAFVSKLAGACARIALAFQALADPNAQTITGECMRAACGWAPFLIGHAQSVLGHQGDPVHVNAKLLLAWITRGRLVEFATGECFRAIRSKRVHSPATLEPAYDLLSVSGYIRRCDAPDHRRPGRPAIRYEVNPLVHVE